jgi:hypothetical protein
MSRGAAVLPAGGRPSIAPRRSGRHDRAHKARGRAGELNAVPFHMPTGLADGLEPESALEMSFSSHSLRPATGVPTGSILGPPHQANKPGFGGHT